MNRNAYRRKSIDYILPFLILICVGIIGVLTLQLWQALQPRELETEAYFYLVEGKAKHLPWGINEWESAYSGTKIVQGDSVKTSAYGQAVLRLYDGSLVRLGGGTELILYDLKRKADTFSAQILLRSGDVWVNSRGSDFSSSSIVVRGKNVRAKIEDEALFAVESNTREIVRNMKGKVEVDVILLDGENEKTVETNTLQSNQRLEVNKGVLSAFRALKSPQIISDVTEQFKETEWYRWNVKEDRSPTDFKKKEDVVEEIPVDVTQESTQEVVENDEEKEDEMLAEEEILPVKITAPDALKHTLKKSALKVSGTAPPKAQKIIIVSEDDDDEYALRHFEPGDDSWRYTVAEQYGNLKPGINTYKVYAEYASGKRSEAVELVVDYEKEEEEEVKEEKDATESE